MQTVKRTRRSASSSSDPVSSTRHRSEKVVKKKIGHTPVLLHEVVDVLALRPSDIVLDATLGGAGHALAIANHLNTTGMLIGIDADREAIERARAALSTALPRTHFKQANFRTLKEAVAEAGASHITKALFDLGWSSYQLDAERGFSFLKDEPLLMTYADAPQEETLTAEKIVNTWEEENIADVIYGWGEERYARVIAKAICAARAASPIRTSRELGDIIARAVPGKYRHGKIHPATRTFQALRIAVNDELGALKEGLQSAWDLLEKGGRIAVITFHSIEDREVKNLMREWEEKGKGERVTRGVVKPTREEIAENPRARSAKLRCIEKF